jgi:hypothetical protein
MFLLPTDSDVDEPAAASSAEVCRNDEPEVANSSKVVQKSHGTTAVTGKNEKSSGSSGSKSHTGKTTGAKDEGKKVLEGRSVSQSTKDGSVGRSLPTFKPPDNSKGVQLLQAQRKNDDASRTPLKFEGKKVRKESDVASSTSDSMRERPLSSVSSSNKKSSSLESEKASAIKTGTGSTNNELDASKKSNEEDDDKDLDEPTVDQIERHVAEMAVKQVEYDSTGLFTLLDLEAR